MKKSGSVRNVLALCILIVNFLGNLLLHILQKEKIGPKITAKIDRVAAALWLRECRCLCHTLHSFISSFFFPYAWCSLVTEA